MSLVCSEIKKGVVFEGENISRKFLIIERWVQIAMWSVSRNVLHATESESILVRSSHQFALIITVWKLITITQFTSQRFNKIHDFHDGAILEELVDYKMQQQLTLTQGHLSRDECSRI